MSYVLESDDLRARIVGLPREDPEASLAESKFKHAVEGLLKVYPKLAEVRATIKVVDLPKERKRHEVHVFIDQPGHRFEFNVEGWSLAETFDQVTQKLKELKTKPEKNPGFRRRVPRGEFESATMTEGSPE